VKKIIVFLVFFALIVIIFSKFFLFNEKNRLAVDINRLKNAVERENKTQVLIYLDETYHDQNDMTYQELINTIDDLFEAGDSIKILLSGMKIKIDSTTNNNIFASCSLGIKVFAKYEGENTILFGGIIKPASARGYFKKSGSHYRLYSAEY